MDPRTAGDLLNVQDGYEMTETDKEMAATGDGQLFGQFLLDCDGVIRWSFTEVPEEGRRMFARPSPDELIEAADRIV